MNQIQQTPEPLTVHLWDEVSGEWGPAYPRVAPDDNRKVHEETMKFIELETGEDAEDVLKYRVNVEGVGINIGFYGRNMLYIELWGEQAEAMVKIAQAQLEWFPNSPREALMMLVDLHGLAKRAVGD